MHVSVIVGTSIYRSIFILHLFSKETKLALHLTNSVLSFRIIHPTPFLTFNYLEGLKETVFLGCIPKFSGISQIARAISTYITMLLRSSSTPILGSLLSSFSDSSDSSSSNDISTTFKHGPIHHKSLNKIPYHQTQTVCLNLTTASCNSSPISPFIGEFSDGSYKGFHRSQSDGNLQGQLDYSSSSSNHIPNQTKMFAGRSNHVILEPIPAFSFSNRGVCNEEDDEEESDIQGKEKKEDAKLESSHFAASNKMENMVLREEVSWIKFGMQVLKKRGSGLMKRCISQKGLELIVIVMVMVGAEAAAAASSIQEVEMVETCMTLRSIIRGRCRKILATLCFLELCSIFASRKQDLRQAEEYYSRTILADPKDGEILSQDANVVWELHQDQDRASCYFERAVQASPDDSHVHAAYASFLWETEEGNNEHHVPKDFDVIPPHFHEGAKASAGA